jgi:hypothetical protein
MYGISTGDTIHKSESDSPRCICMHLHYRHDIMPYSHESDVLNQQVYSTPSEDRRVNINFPRVRKLDRYVKLPVFTTGIINTA